MVNSAHVLHPTSALLNPVSNKTRFLIFNQARRGTAFKAKHRLDISLSFLPSHSSVFPEFEGGKNKQATTHRIRVSL